MTETDLVSETSCFYSQDTRRWEKIPKRTVILWNIRKAWLSTCNFLKTEMCKGNWKHANENRIHKFKSHPRLINTRAIISICGYSPFLITITTPQHHSPRVLRICDYIYHAWVNCGLRSGLRTLIHTLHHENWNGLGSQLLISFTPWCLRQETHKKCEETRARFNMPPRTAVNRKHHYIRTGRGWFYIPIQLIRGHKIA
jgi:hypothetical protein